MQGKRPGGGAAVSLGFDLAVGVGFLTFGGYWLDQRAGGGQAWTLTGFGLSVLFAAYEIWKTIRGLESESKPGGKDSPDAKSRNGGEPLP